ncbi:MAG: LPS export ABC transporter periplasmic protein LptC [Chlorobiaceae bacterium]|nr:LPS export ABC transporter periplasmic protein LptC [Chlorobiaceae bacterium]
MLSCTVGCDAPEKGHHMPTSGLSGKQLPAQESWDMTLALEDAGKAKTLISAKHAAEYHQGEKKEILIDGGISVTIFGRDNAAPTRITAGRGIVHDNQDIEAFNDVVISAGDGTVVRTEHITRSNKDRMLRSDKYVTVTKPSQTIRGTGFESDEAMTRYKIFHASGEAVSK